MKNSKKIWILLFLGGLLTALLSTLYTDQNDEHQPTSNVGNVSVGKTDVSTSSSVQIDDEIAASNTVKPAVHIGTSDENNNLKFQNINSEDWCIAEIELSESDKIIAKTQVDDWYEQQGRARAKSPAMSYADELSYPNNSLIESYEALTLQELESLAINEDKWAMITLVQNPFADQNVKEEVAKKLLIQGASYYAIEYLVIQSLTSAKTSYRVSDSIDDSIGHIIDALVYVYWGLEHYNDGGLTPFIGITSREPFKTELTVDILLNRYEGEVKSRYSELSNWIQEERNKLGINVPVVPPAAQRLFAESLAINLHLAREQMDFLESMKVNSNRTPLAKTQCVEAYLSDMLEKIE